MDNEADMMTFFAFLSRECECIMMIRNFVWKIIGEMVDELK